MQGAPLLSGAADVPQIDQQALITALRIDQDLPLCHAACVWFNAYESIAHQLYKNANEEDQLII